MGKAFRRMERASSILPRPTADSISAASEKRPPTAATHACRIIFWRTAYLVMSFLSTLRRSIQARPLKSDDYADNII